MTESSNSSRLTTLLAVWRCRYLTSTCQSGASTSHSALGCWKRFFAGLEPIRIEKWLQQEPSETAQRRVSRAVLPAAERSYSRRAFLQGEPRICSSRG